MSIGVVIMIKKKNTIKKEYYPFLDFLRIFSCLAILLYHLNLLPGGFLAVCAFFTLTGYLSWVSANKRETFSMLDYYKNRFLKVYLPLVVTVFLTIFVLSFIKDITWLNLKPETTSVLFGYNNIWQLSVNLDYFARHINSPFMHFWFIAILLQFEIIFPFLFCFFKKLEEKGKKHFSCIITGSLVILSSSAFLFLAGKDMMASYYHTGTRIFSIFLGLFLALIHTYYKPLILKKLQEEKWAKSLIFLYILILFLLFYFIDAQNPLYSFSMLLVSIITCRIIEYSKNIKQDSKSSLKEISNITYEIYLLQYPVIFLFQSFQIKEPGKIILILLTIFLLSTFLYLAFRKKEKNRIVSKILQIIFLLIAILGCYKYVISADHTEEMKALEEELAKNEELLNAKKEQQEQKLKEEKQAFEESIEDLENEEKLTEMIHNLPVVGVGDSVMLGAVENLYEMFPNGYFDAKISRTAWVLNGILQNLKNNNALGDPIIINVGANGDGPDNLKEEIMSTCENREVFWLNVTNDKDVHVNKNLYLFSQKYDNLHIIDWASISKDHAEYFVADGIHLTPEGRKAYTSAIFEEMKRVYEEKRKQKKEELLKEQEEKEKRKITFLGNDMVINAYNEIQVAFPNASFKAQKEYSFETIKEEIQKEIEHNTLSNQLVFVFDKTLSFSKEEIEEIASLCQKQNLYFISVAKEGNEMDLSHLKNVTIIPFYDEEKENTDYYRADNIHLNENGKKALINLLKEKIN